MTDPCRALPLPRFQGAVSRLLPGQRGPPGFDAFYALFDTSSAVRSRSSPCISPDGIKSRTFLNAYHHRSLRQQLEVVENPLPASRFRGAIPSSPVIATRLTGGEKSLPIDNGLGKLEQVVLHSPVKGFGRLIIDPGGWPNSIRRFRLNATPMMLFVIAAVSVRLKSCKRNLSDGLLNAD